VSAALHFSIRYTDNIARDEETKLAQHREVMEAILSRDPELAERTARNLLLEAKALMEGGLEPVIEGVAQ
jgi:DNA-binding FadR family transcriptional regulator